MGWNVNSRVRVGPEVGAQPALSRLTLLGVRRQPTEHQGSQPVGRGTAIRVKSQRFERLHPGFVANRIVVDEVEAAVRVLAPANEHGRSVRRCRIQCRRGVQRRQCKDRRRQIRFHQRRREGTRLRLARTNPAIAPTAIRLVVRVPAKLLGQLPFLKKLHPGIAGRAVFDTFGM